MASSLHQGQAKAAAEPASLPFGADEQPLHLAGLVRQAPVGDAAERASVALCQERQAAGRPIGREALRQLRIERLMAESRVHEPGVAGIAVPAPLDIVAHQGGKVGEVDVACRGCDRLGHCFSCPMAASRNEPAGRDLTPSPSKR